MKTCKECQTPVEGRSVFCEEHKKQRAYQSRFDAQWGYTKRALEDLKDMDCPMRLDKLVDLAIRTAL